MRSDLISIIIPFYNEAPALKELYCDIKKVMTPLAKYEVIFVDDGSTDDGGQIVKQLVSENEPVVYIKHLHNVGKTMALMNGFSVANGEIAILMDADLQDPPEDIPLFLEKMDAGFDLVNGLRATRRDKLSRRFVSGVYNFIVNLILRIDNIDDVNCGFKAIRKKYYKRLKLVGDMHRILPAIANAYGANVSQVEVHHKPRKYGESKYNLLRHRGILDIFAFSGAHASRWRPFHVFVEFSLIFWSLLFLSILAWIFLGYSTGCEGFYWRFLWPVFAGSGVVNFIVAFGMMIMGLGIEILSQKINGSQNTVIIEEIVNGTNADLPSSNSINVNDECEK